MLLRYYLLLEQQARRRMIEGAFVARAAGYNKKDFKKFVSTLEEDEDG